MLKLHCFLRGCLICSTMFRTKDSGITIILLAFQTQKLVADDEKINGIHSAQIKQNSLFNVIIHPLSP